MHYTSEELQTFLQKHPDAALGWNPHTQEPHWQLLMHPAKTSMQYVWFNPEGLRILLSYPQGKTWLESRIANDYTAYVCDITVRSTIAQCLGIQETTKIFKPLDQTLLMHHNLGSTFGKRLWSDPWTLRLHAEVSKPATWKKYVQDLFHAYTDKMQEKRYEKYQDRWSHHPDHDTPPFRIWIQTITDPAFAAEYPDHAASIITELTNWLKATNTTSLWKTLYENGELDAWVVPEILRPHVSTCLDIPTNCWTNKDTPLVDATIQHFARQGHPANKTTPRILDNIRDRRAYSAQARECGLQFIEKNSASSNDLAQYELYRTLAALDHYTPEQVLRIKAILARPEMQDGLDHQFWQDRRFTQSSPPIYQIPRNDPVFLEMLPAAFWQRRLCRLLQNMMDEKPHNPMAAATAFESGFSEVWRTLAQTTFPSTVLGEDSTISVYDAVLSVLLYRSGIPSNYTNMCAQLDQYVQTTQALDMAPNAEDFIQHLEASKIDMEWHDFDKDIA